VGDCDCVSDLVIDVVEDGDVVALGEVLVDADSLPLADGVVVGNVVAL
jgi:hypothetical protein